MISGSRTIGSWGPESEVADLLASTERAFEGVAIGSYPFFKEGRVGANFVVRATALDVVDACTDALAAGLRAAGHEAFEGGI